MTSRKIRILAVLVLVGSAGDGQAFDVTVSVNNVRSFDDHAITLNPGDAFSIDINVYTASEVFNIYGARLSASASDVLSVTDGFIHFPWTDYNGTLPLGELNPLSDPFGVVLPFPEYFGPGESTLATLGLLVDSNAIPDVYTLNIVGAEYIACRICPAFSSADSGPDFVITVVPEPPTAWLVAFGVLLLIRRCG